jgi:hypothetical protein
MLKVLLPTFAAAAAAVASSPLELGWLPSVHGHLSASATALRRRPNEDYWRNLIDAGLIPEPASFKATAADPWNTSAIKGVNYIPSYAHNSIETFMNYSATTIATELGYAAAAKTTTVRLVLHWLPWQYAPSTFFANLDHFIATAASNGMQTVLAVFDGTGCCDPTPQWIPSGQYVGQGWLQNPGPAMIANASSWPQLDAYVQALIGRYGSDARVIGFDAHHQPNLGSTGNYDFLKHYSQMLYQGVNPKTAFTTITIIPGGAACDASVIPLDYQNVISFENYNGNLGAIAGDTQGVQGCAASIQSSRGPNADPLPVILSGTMTRQSMPVQGLCDCRYEAAGLPWVNIPSHPAIGLFVNYLMLGVSEFSQGNPPNQGLIWPNGTWYDPTEAYCWTAATPPIPPPPPGPPAPFLNFTAGGLEVGLRSGSRAIQFLGLTNETSKLFGWVTNFSFVPPLWNFLPGFPHRDFPGNNHIGDISLRVQPASETNASSWAFYASSHGGDQTPAILLNISNSVIIDAADITPALNAGGQIDTRYSLACR